MKKVNRLWCEYCGKRHKKRTLQQNWAGINPVENEKYQSADRVICPKCLKKILKPVGETW